jgi:hypothetical protein
MGRLEAVGLRLEKRGGIVDFEPAANKASYPA